MKVYILAPGGNLYPVRVDTAHSAYKWGAAVLYSDREYRNKRPLAGLVAEEGAHPQ